MLHMQWRESPASLWPCRHTWFGKQGVVDGQPLEGGLGQRDAGHKVRHLVLLDVHLVPRAVWEARARGKGWSDPYVLSDPWHCLLIHCKKNQPTTIENQSTPPP